MKAQPKGKPKVPEEKQTVRRTKKAGPPPPAPPMKLPDGSPNPAYRRWRRAHGSEAEARYRHSEKAKACRQRFRASAKAKAYEKARADKLKHERHENGAVVPRGHYRCVECRLHLDQAEAIVRGCRFLGPPAQMICNECLQD